VLKRELIGVEVEGIDIDEAGNFVISLPAYKAIEEIFGKQTPVFVGSTYVVLDQIKVGRFFRIAVHDGVPMFVHNVTIDDVENWWTVDPPDIYELGLAADEHEVPTEVIAKIRHMFIALINSAHPVTAVRQTFVRNTFPKRGVTLPCCHVTPGAIIDGVLGGKLDGTFAIEGVVTMFIRPVV